MRERIFNRLFTVAYALEDVCQDLHSFARYLRKLPAMFFVVALVVSGCMGSPVDVSTPSSDASSTVVATNCTASYNQPALDQHVDPECRLSNNTYGFTFQARTPLDVSLYVPQSFEQAGALTMDRVNFRVGGFVCDKWVGQTFWNHDATAPGGEDPSDPELWSLIVNAQCNAGPDAGFDVNVAFFQPSQP